MPNDEEHDIHMKKIRMKKENNDEELCDILIQVYSFLKEQNKHFEKEIVKEKIDNF